jgi:lipopolysaccharide transport system permease protein
MSYRKHPVSPRAIVASFWNHRHLIWQMTKRDVAGRYRGSIMGLAWSFFNPVLMLIVYTFVFAVVFKARWGVGVHEGKAEFAIILFVGLIVHGLFAECINRAPGLILSNANYVKKVVFPLEVLPWVTLGSAFFHAAMSFAVLLLFMVVMNFPLTWTAVFTPFVLLPFLFLVMGFSWFLAATGVFLRDIGQVIGIVTTVLMFLAPIFYPRTAVPEAYRHLLQLNPLTFIVEQGRDVLIWGKMPDWSGLVVYSIACLLIAWSGFFWFQTTRRGFADVI